MRLKLIFSIALLLFVYLNIQPTTIQAQASESYIHNATGGVQIAYVVNDQTFGLFHNEHLIKQLLDDGWEPIAEVMNQLNGDLPGLPKEWDVTIFNHFAPTTMTELQMTELPDGLILTYIAHENYMGLEAATPSWWLDSSVVIGFNVEFSFRLQVNADGRSLQLATPTVRITRQGSNSTGLMGAVLMMAADNLLEQGEAQLTKLAANSLALLRETLDNHIAKETKIPAGLRLRLAVRAPEGTVLMCFRRSTDGPCAFMAKPSVNDTTPATAATTTTCDRPVLRVWNAASAGYVIIALTGHQVELPVDAEVYWRCGWEDALGSSSAIAVPVGAEHVRVTRDDATDQIFWQFLYEQ